MAQGRVQYIAILKVKNCAVRYYLNAKKNTVGAAGYVSMPQIG